MSNDVDSRGLRFTFVEVLYALTIAEVATQIAKLVVADQTPITAPAAFAHLTLAMCLVAASWVDWPQSKAPGNAAPVDSVFTWGFVILLVDVTLVIFYFILAQGVERVSAWKDGSTLGVASASNETFWTMLVFLVYFLWDVLTKVVYPEGKFWQRGRISLACAALAVVIWYYRHDGTGDAQVVLTDFSLIALVFLFRALKQGLRTASAILALLMGTFFAAVSRLPSATGQ